MSREFFRARYGPQRRHWLAETYITSTARPLTIPPFRSANTLLTSSNFDLRISARTLPSAANAIGSADLRGPDDRAADGNSIHDNIEDGRLKLTGRRLIVPLRRTNLRAWANAAGDTRVTSTPCAPPPVSLITCAAASGALAFTVTSAPDARASGSQFARFSSSRANSMRHAVTHNLPEPPASSVAATISPNRAPNSPTAKARLLYSVKRKGASNLIWRAPSDSKMPSAKS
jgi:hypothetical protein